MSEENKILNSEMLTTNVFGLIGVHSLLKPINNNNNHNFDDNMNKDSEFLIDMKTLKIVELLNEVTIESMWSVCEWINENLGYFRDKFTGNTFLHYIIETIPLLVEKYGHYLVDFNQIYPEWAGAIVAVLYRAVVRGQCPVNAQNYVGNTIFHLVCLKPYTEFLAVHLIRLGADPDIKNNAGLNVYYNIDDHKAWLIKNMPGLECGIWNAIKREDMEKVDYYLSCWCRTVVNQTSGKTLFETAMSTGNYDLVRHVDRLRNTNELIMASLALDIEYMQKLLSIKLEKEKCDLHRMDISFIPHRPLVAELKLIYGIKALNAIALLKNYGAQDESIYLKQLENEKMMFVNSEFYHQIQKSNSLNDLHEAWNLIDRNDFNPNARRHTDRATYLHYLVECYAAWHTKPILQKGLIRLMAKLVIAGVNIQTRDINGNTAIVLGAKLTQKLNLEINKRLQIKNVNQNNLDEQFGDQLIANSESAINLHENIEEKQKLKKDCCNPIKFGPIDQRLMTILIQLGSDTSLSCNEGYLVCYESYLPRNSFALKKQKQLHTTATNNNNNNQACLPLPGIWTALDQLIHSIQHQKCLDLVELQFNNLKQEIENYLIRIRTKRSGLSAIEWIKSLWIKKPNLLNNENNILIEKNQVYWKLIGQKLVNTLQSYLDLTDFATFCLAGDIVKMKQCLAKGNGCLKSNLHLKKFIIGIDSKYRAKVLSRPLIIHAMEYSTYEAVSLMIKNGTDLSEFYTETKPYGPVAFWAFKPFVSLHVTYEVIKLAPVGLRDSDGSNMLHYAVARYRDLNADDFTGLKWVTLIINELLKKGIRFDLRDKWGRTAHDILHSNQNMLNGNSDDKLSSNMLSKHFEEQPPDPFDLRDILDSNSEKILTAEQLINRRCAFLANLNQLDEVEDLILSGYDRLNQANSASSNPKSARQLAERKGFIEMTSLLDKATEYRQKMCEIHATVIFDDYQRFVRLVNENRLILSLDWRGRSLLHLAVIYRRTQFALLLIELCPDLVTIRDCLGRTPLHLAICLGDNRSLFLKCVAKIGSIDKQMKDYKNISIAEYGEFYDHGVSKFLDLIRAEKSVVIFEPNWPKNYIVKENNVTALPTISEEKNSECRNKRSKSSNNCRKQIMIEATYPLACPLPSAFNLTDLKRIHSAFGWRK